MQPIKMNFKAIKNSVIVVLMCFGMTSVFAQQSLSIKIIEGADKPNTESEHFYLIEISNTSNASALFNISTRNIVCSGQKARLSQIDTRHEVMNKQKSLKLDERTIQPHGKLEFYVKISRSKTAKLNSWNCTEIRAISNQGNALSNTIVIESLVPNTNDFN